MRRKGGFTLIELSIAMVVAAILAGIVVPDFVRSVRIEAGKKTAMEISQIAEAVRAYYVDQDVWPGTFDDLRAKGFIDETWLARNPFGEPYSLSVNGMNMDVHTILPAEILPVTAGLLPMAVVEGVHLRSTVTLPGLAAMGVPAGVIVPWGAHEVPFGWLVCDGRAVSRAQQPALFEVIGTTYGAGDGMTTFNLPDLRGRVALGLDDMGSGMAHVVDDAQARVLGGRLGMQSHQLTVAEMPAHAHQQSIYGNPRSGWRKGVEETRENSDANWRYTDQHTGLTGGGLPHANLQPSMALYWIIKA